MDKLLQTYNTEAILTTQISLPIAFHTCFENQEGKADFTEEIQMFSFRQLEFQEGMLKFVLWSNR